MPTTGVTTLKRRYEMPVPTADAISARPERPMRLVRIHPDEGIVRLSEAVADGGFLESRESLALGRLGWTIVGQVPFRVARW